MEKITVYLGSRCNLNCRYCHREAGVETGVSPKLMQKLRSASIVGFIGGEPTLYMPQIKYIVRALPRYVYYRITTNGKNFKAYESFFLKHHFFVCVSYDGNNALRGFDPFTEVCRYPWLGVSTTLYHGNTDFKTLFHEFAEAEKRIWRPLSFYPHIMHVTNPRNGRYALTLADMDNIFSQYKDCVSRFVETYERYGIENRRFRGLFKQLYERTVYPYEWGETYCANRRTSKMDTEGGDWSCLYLRDTKKSDMLAYMEKHFPKCKDCPVYGLCGGACVKSVQHERECYLYGKLYGWWMDYSAVHREAVEGLAKIPL